MSEMDALQPGVDIRPKITVGASKILIEKLYGFESSQIIELNGYDDKNFKVTVTNNYRNKNVDSVSEDGYVLKILNSLDSQKIDFVSAQNQLLIYLGNNDVNCPIPVPTVDGKLYSLEKLSSGFHVVRLLKFIPGILLYKAPISPNLCYQTGMYIATLDKVLQGFKHPAYETHKSFWMLDAVPELRKFLFVLKDDVKREAISDIVQEFEARVLSNKVNLQTGMIHGDFNEQNILVEKVKGEWNVKAILDFGDSQCSCYLFELAITLTYMMILGKNLDTGGHVIAGYSKIRKIPEEEFSLLKICVEARLCQSLVMGVYSNMQDPNNSYVLTTSKSGWELLEKLRSKSDEEVLKTWKSVSAQYSS